MEVFRTKREALAKEESRKSLATVNRTLASVKSSKTLAGIKTSRTVATVRSNKTFAVKSSKSLKKISFADSMDPISFGAQFTPRPYQVYTVGEEVLVREVWVSQVRLLIQQVSMGLGWLRQLGYVLCFYRVKILKQENFCTALIWRVK